MLNGLTEFEFKLGFINYLFGDKLSSKRKNPSAIFENSKILLNKMNVKYGGNLEEGHLFTYATDGLIFMPIDRPLYNFKVCKPINGNEKPLLCNRKVPSYFKWKPKSKLSIDFRINFIKNKKGERIIHFENGEQYVELELKSRNYNSFIYNKFLYVFPRI